MPDVCYPNAPLRADRGDLRQRRTHNARTERRQSHRFLAQFQNLVRGRQARRTLGHTKCQHPSVRSTTWLDRAAVLRVQPVVVHGDRQCSVFLRQEERTLGPTRRLVVVTMQRPLPRGKVVPSVRRPLALGMQGSPVREDAFRPCRAPPVRRGPAALGR